MKTEIFDKSASSCLKRYKRILWGGSLGCKKLLKFTCLILKFHKRHYTTIESTFRIFGLSHLQGHIIVFKIETVFPRDKNSSFIRKFFMKTHVLIQNCSLLNSLSFNNFKVSKNQRIYCHKNFGKDVYLPLWAFCCLHWTHIFQHNHLLLSRIKIIYTLLEVFYQDKWKTVAFIASIVFGMI